MKDFGEWISENKHAMHEDVYGLFNDSYKCYRNDIDRPAYLLAYQGMMQYVRLTVLTASCKPVGFSDSEWNEGWLANLRNDDKWDEIAFKCTQQLANAEKGKAAVMNIRQEVREKFVFWRQLRNVCAHYKGYDLHKAHTLALYSYIEQYLFTISVEGSQVSLNRQFDDYFNPVLTSAHEDISPLLEKIAPIIHDSEFNTFFVEVRKSCAKYARFTSRFHDFIHEVITKCPLRVKDAAIQYLRSDNDYRDDYLDTYPKDVIHILSGTDCIHEFWYSRLPHSRKKLILLALMLESEMIPTADRDEAMMRCLRNSEDYPSMTDYIGLSKEIIGALANAGYFNLFYEMYFNASFTSTNCRAICYKTDFYIGMVRIIPWDRRYVDQLIAIFNEPYFPFTLRDRLRDMYNEDAEYHTAIDNICAKEGLTLPDEIK